MGSPRSRDEGGHKKFTPTTRGFRTFPQWLLWSHEGQPGTPWKRILPLWLVAFPWPASLLEGMPHISVPRSDNLVNLGAEPSTCSCSGTLPAGRGLLSGSSRYSCLVLFVPVAKPPASAPLSGVQVQQAWLSFLELCESQRHCQCRVRSLARLAAVRAQTPLSRVHKTVRASLRMWS